MNVEARPKYSIIIPTYNRASVLDRAIDSVLDQTYGDFEIIVVDDGSTDNTKQLVREYEDIRIRYLAHDENLGQNVARNTGIEAANGSLISYLDSDDVFTPDHLERVDAKFEELPSRFAGVITAYTDHHNNTKAKHTIYSGEIRLEDLLSGNMYEGIGGLSILTFKSECIDDIGFHDERITKCTDWDFYLQILQEYSLYGLNEDLCIRFKQEDSVSLNSKNIIQGEMRFLEKYSDILSGYNISLRRRNIGMAYATCGEMPRARKVFARCILDYPYSLSNYRNFLLACLGEKYFHRYSDFWTEIY